MGKYTLDFTASEINNRLSKLDNTPISMELVWQNASPTSKFEPQTINFTKTSNDIVCVEFLDYTDNSLKKTCMVQNGSGSLESIRHVVNGGTEPPYIFQRAFDVSNSGVTFGTCMMKLTNSGTSYPNENHGCVPNKIFIIKGVQ